MGFVFLTLEDEHGLMNVIVRPDVYTRYRSLLRGYQLVAIAGRVQRSSGLVNVPAMVIIVPGPSAPPP